ncbi:MAG: hypothetical protein RhofKO_01710 [Rhodothermales bacterium]
MSRLLTALLFVALLSGCEVLEVFEADGQSIRGSGDLVTQTLDLEGVTELSAGSDFKVRIFIGDDARAELTYDDNLDDYLDVDLTRKRLAVGLVEPYKNNYKRVTLQLDVTVPTLNALHLSGGSSATFEHIHTMDDFEFSLSGGSTAEGELTASDVSIRVSGGGVLQVRDGRVGFLEVQGSGGGEIDFRRVQGKGADVRLSGGSDVSLRVDGRVDLDLSGGSALYLYGNPRLGQVELSGGATVDQRN